MGVHVTLTIAHDFKDLSLDTVRQRFEPLEELSINICRKFQIESGEWIDMTESGNEWPRIFRTTGRYSLNFGRAALSVHHFIRFSEFTAESTEKEIIREFGRHLAKTLNQPKIIYAPCEGIGDEIMDWVYDGLNLAQIEDRLRERIDPPATIAELATRSCPQPRYFIDDFTD